MGQRIFNSIALFLFLLTIGIVSFLAINNIRKDPFANQEKCVQLITVKMGEHIFNVPRQAYFENNAQVVKPKPCEQDSLRPLEVTSFFLSLHEMQGVDTEGEREGYGFAAQLGVSLFSENNRPSDSFIKVLSEQKIKENDILNMDLVQGFYQFEYIPQNFLLIPSDDKFLTPRGNPVLFVCNPYGSNQNSPLHCGTGFVWKDNLYVGFNDLSLAWVPKENLRNFYEKVLTYVSSLEVTK